MYKDELIEKTKKLLNNIPSLKEKFKNGELKGFEKIEFKSLINILNDLPKEQQKLIAYKYFENRSQIQIANMLNMGINTVPRRLNKIVVEIGRGLYGMEEEFWNMIAGIEEDKKRG
ncbi:sigma-70 family RNA polymerase sigma factor [Clostridium botulinum]|uniref:sigma-70 family RNA polymerase sigma factor n=1 Tax=Clostridium botulinum TaxID=1491 RepID=UPI00077321DA|nr:sigma-70 family RNA polymerase sigma factor [Clostridium botulinum]NFL86830.1 sigma-70 family RNA polymerase sigma factor [Clostridium botulinum]NFO21856.1 sigma-70 family RNA polymerase sigma factor [Clostridium botulinum]